MNLFKVADFYIGRIANSQSKSSRNEAHETRIKALLLDKHTTGPISMCTTQTELLEHEIYLIDTLENENRDVMRHLKCLVYAKPTDESIELLVKELANPKYGEYQIFFNNTVTKTQLERLAECDDLELVSKVEEVFQDYQILNEDLFSLDLPPAELFSNQLIWEPSGLQKTSQSLVSLLLSLKLKPQVRFEAGSRLTSKLAQEVVHIIDQNERTLFDFPPMDAPPLLLILDRHRDALTPMLQPWTYQSMINEYMGIKRNVVDLSKVPEVDSSMEQVVLSAKQDPFFHDTMYLNFGELGDKVKQYVSSYKNKTKSNSQINTIEDIKQFIGKFPEFRKLSGNVSKHMAIVGELDRQLQLQHIWEISELEQNISTHAGDSQNYEDLQKLLSDPKVDNYYKLKLACIYSLKIGENTHTAEISKALATQLSPEEVNFFHHFNNIFQIRTRQSTAGREREDLISELAKKFNQKGHHKTDNVFMQHVPELFAFLNGLSKNKISDEKYPYVKNPVSRSPPQDVIIFFVGGATYEEARVLHQFNETMVAENSGKMRVILGGTSMMNTHEFMNYCRGSGQKTTELSDLL
ncbi:LANO_0F01200g1_1 [Lachancea nothofagi CBS 11611]|uniref:LANO_0F01200g1_1 n=1 Tax=Lachancea nothofagi CBS 11611 TaxID=1266666 RepID=A0A1G4K5Y5_9SACH|nr:LANO_0F01200g1_1 [Lachancea nothofagi CBS 11611]